MLTIYFSGTGNTKYIAKLFSDKVGAKCLSIEADADFTSEFKAHNTIAFCYPIYGSRVPRNMREFVLKHMSDINGKKIIILLTQMLFSGDGARVFTDMFWEGAVKVIYAEHFFMPNNICNTPLLRHASMRKMLKCKAKAEAKMTRVCSDIKQGIVKKRGFSRLSQWLGNIQGRAWQGDSKDDSTLAGFELRAKDGIKIHDACKACGICTKLCPMKNLASESGRVKQLGNCIVCYRCVNRCPQKAITVLFHRRPKWQYRGIFEL